MPEPQHDPPGLLAAYEEKLISRQELESWLLEHLLKVPSDVAVVLDLLGELEGGEAARFSALLAHLEPETELLLHRRTVQVPPALLAAIKEAGCAL